MSLFKKKDRIVLKDDGTYIWVTIGSLTTGFLKENFVKIIQSTDTWQNLWGAKSPEKKTAGWHHVKP